MNRSHFYESNRTCVLIFVVNINKVNVCNYFNIVPIQYCNEMRNIVIIMQHLLVRYKPNETELYSNFEISNSHLSHKSK